VQRFLALSLDMALHFGGREVATIRTNGLYSRPPSGSAAPVLAYLDLEDISTLRLSSVHLPPRRTDSLPVIRIRRKQARRIKPANELEDAYMVAALIALAQGRRRQWREAAADTTEEATESSHKTPTCFTVCLGCTHLLSVTYLTKGLQVHLLAYPSVAEARNLYFYTACISAAFLERFDQPSRHFSSGPLRISYYRILLRPKPHLIQAMGRAISTVRSDKP
jgi:hypothetical protein